MLMKIFKTLSNEKILKASGVSNNVEFSVFTKFKKLISDPVIK